MSCSCCTSCALKCRKQTDQSTVHDPDFRQSEKDWFSFVEKLTERLVEIDDTVPELPVKDIVRCPLHRARRIFEADGTDLPHLSGCPLLERSHPIQGAHALLASRPAACPSPPRLAPPTPAACRMQLRDIACFANARAVKPFFSAACMPSRPGQVLRHQ